VKKKYTWGMLVDLFGPPWVSCLKASDFIPHP